MLRNRRRAYEADGTEIPPLTLGAMRAQGIARVDLYCNGRQCHHAAKVDASGLPDDLPVPDVSLRFRCSACGSRDIESRPDWTQMKAAGMGR